MKKNSSFYVSLSLLIAFIVWTVLVKFVNVSLIGPQNSSVGLFNVNQKIFNLTGVNMFLYSLTDWLSLLPIAVMFIYFLVGLGQLIRRKNIFKVDYNILVLGVYYIVVFLFYFLFEILVINYRPVLINGILEPSYPSSTTLLVVSVMLTNIFLIDYLIKNKKLKIFLNTLSKIYTIFMVVARLVSGVHWFSDIVGGILLGLGLVFFYKSIIFSKKV